MQVRPEKWWSRDHRLNPWEWPAYLADIYRVFPRMIFIFATFMIAKVGLWYMYVLTTSDRTAEVSAFVAVAVGAYVKLMDYYMQRGNDWSKRLQINGGESSATIGTNINVSQG